MQQKSEYISSLRKEEREVLQEYQNFLLIFYKAIKDPVFSHFQEYKIMEEKWQKRLRSIDRVKKAFDCHDLCQEAQSSTEKCSDLLRKISHSLDIRKAELHDEISSLNKKNSAMGLRYNRYNTQSAKPGLIDINL